MPCSMHRQVDKLMALRKQINEALAASDGAKLSINDFIVKASALVRSCSLCTELYRVGEAAVPQSDSAITCEPEPKPCS